MRQFPLSLVAAAACLACSDSLTPAPTPSLLLGHWSAAPEAEQPSGSFERRFVFTSDGRFSYVTLSYGIYAGESPTELSGYTRTTGVFLTESAHLVLLPDSLITWDRFYGGASPETVHTPYPYGNTFFFDSAQYTIDGDRLTLQYISYPADAPVPTTQEFQRQP